MPPRKKTTPTDDQRPERRECGTDEVHEHLLRTVDGYAEARSEIENRTSRMLAFGPAALRTGCTEIPVVVHVVHRNSGENISDSQIQSQIDVLNADFRAANPDRTNTPAVFQPLIGDARITFRLATVDPAGNPTNGITRTSSSNGQFTSTLNDVKAAASGGADAWPADRYLNVWTCGNLRSGTGQSLLGYAQFPGGPAATDGVVILHSAFGTTGTASAPFDGGRTATHEIGHWLNLRHIWGDDGTGCSGDDFVADTPNAAGPNYGSPAFPHVTCNNGPNGDLFMNYMDYTDDAAMFMFTQGQVDRMQAALDGPRSSIGTTGPCSGPKPVKEFVKDLNKDVIKDGPKDRIKDAVKESFKDNPKDLGKDGMKDVPKDPIKDAVKEGFKEPIKENPKDLVKDRPKEFAKDLPLEGGKHLVADLPPKSVADPVKFGALEGPYIDPTGPLVNPAVNPAINPAINPVFVGGAMPFVLGGRGEDASAGQSGGQASAGGDAVAMIVAQLAQVLGAYAAEAAAGRLDAAGAIRLQGLSSAYAALVAVQG